MQKFIYFALFLSPSVVFANCPSIDSITQVEGHPASWQAPWWQGFSEEEATEDDKVTTFTHACWLDYSRSNANKDTNDSKKKGVFFCFYETKNGIKVFFGQNNRDIQLEKPKQWKKATQNLDMCTKECISSDIESCGFGYPE